MNVLFAEASGLPEALQNIGSLPGKVAGILLTVGIIVVACVAVVALARAAMRR